MCSRHCAVLLPDDMCDSSGLEFGLGSTGRESRSQVHYVTVGAVQLNTRDCFLCVGGWVDRAPFSSPVPPCVHGNLLRHINSCDSVLHPHIRILGVLFIWAPGLGFALLYHSVCFGSPTLDENDVAEYVRALCLLRKCSDVTRVQLSFAELRAVYWDGLPPTRSQLRSSSNRATRSRRHSRTLLVCQQWSISRNLAPAGRVARCQR